MNATRYNHLVIFDCDGTLVDSQYRIIACMNSAFRSFGLPAPADGAVRAIVGLTLEEGIGRLLPAAPAGLPAQVAGVYREAFRAMRLAAPAPEPLYDGAADAIRRLDAAGFMLGVATGKSRRGLDAVLAAHGLDRYFVTLQTADRAPGKPDPAMLRWAMAEAGAAPATTVMVGDTTFDMEMADRAGIKAVGVSWGYHPAADLPAAGATVMIDDFAQLRAAVAELIGEPG